MAANKVVFGTTVLVDLTEDTVEENKLLQGYTAHNKAGEQITGTLVADATLGTKTITENGTYQATSDGVDGYSEVTVDVPSESGALTPVHTDVYSGYVDGAKWTLLSNTRSRTDIYKIEASGYYIIGYGNPAGDRLYIATFDSDPALATADLAGTKLVSSEAGAQFRLAGNYALYIEAGKWLAFTKNRSNIDGQQTVVLFYTKGGG